MRTAALLVGMLCAFGAAAPATAPAGDASVTMVGGSTVTQEDFLADWSFATILRGQSDTFSTSLFCAGALIAPRVVLTAAHCVVGTEQDLEDQTGENFTMQAALGRRVATGSDGEVIPWARVVSHPDYDDVTFANDIALIELASPSASQPAQIVAAGEDHLWGNGAGLARTSEILGPRVGGWGADGVGNAITDEFRAGVVNIGADADCLIDPQLGALDIDMTITTCARLFADAGPPQVDPIDTCQGDSGTPLLVPDGSGGWRIAGIASWGIGCGEEHWGYYTRVAAFRPWISGHLTCGFGTGADLCLPDTTAPGSVQLVSARPGVRQWSALARIQVTFSAAVDDKQVAGYSLVWNTEALTEPDASVDATGTSVTSPLRTSGKAHYLHVRAVDASGNAGPVTHVGPFYIDVQKPTAPGIARLVARTAGAITIRWAPATDNRPIRKYKVLYRVKGAKRWTLAAATPADTRRLVVRRLAAGTAYEFTIVAIDMTGLKSKRSRVATFTTLQQTARQRRAAASLLGRSVIVPSAISAVRPTVSLSVG